MSPVPCWCLGSCLDVPLWSSRRAAPICAPGTTTGSRRADQFRDQDWSNTNVDQLRAHVQDFQDRLAQLDAVAEGRLDTAVSTLRANLDELGQAVADRRR